MVTRDKRIDAYIQKAPAFAKPILTQLRAVVHAACPDVVETVKWRNPSFEYKGLLCGMAAFKQHCTFGFWKHELVVGKRNDEAWGGFGRITDAKALPSKSVLNGYVKKAMQLNEDGVKVERKRVSKPMPKMHPQMQKALGANARVKEQFAGFTPGKQREYIDWIAEAKTDDTRERRLAQAVEWIAEGKPRNWKYMNC